MVAKLDYVIKGKYGSATIHTSTLADSEVLSSTINSLHEMLGTVGVKDTEIHIMPDYHVGKGCVIGTTMQLGERVVPSYVGVDIGCGILAMELEREPTLDELKKLDESMVKILPSGSNIFSGKDIKPKYEKSKLKGKIKIDEQVIANSLGTLGGGNHFVEIGKSEKTGKTYLFIHSGSRGFGASVAKYHIDRAVEYQQELILSKLGKTPEQIIAKYKKEDKTKIEPKLKELKLEKAKLLAKHGGHVRNDHAYLEGELLEDYLHDLDIAQQYAKENRLAMAKAIEKCLGIGQDIVCDSIHNYIELKKDGSKPVLRKGACRAEKDEMLVIPLNMRDGVILAKGKGNEEWNKSAPHGAGRIYSRKRAKSELDIDEFVEEMKDVYTTSVDKSTLDESPMAYKQKEEILTAIKDTIDIEDIIKPIYNFKAKDIK